MNKLILYLKIFDLMLVLIGAIFDYTSLVMFGAGGCTGIILAEVTLYFFDRWRRRRLRK